MRNNFVKIARLTLLSIGYAALAACTTTPTPSIPTLTPVAFLTPFVSPTPSRTPLPPTPLSTIPVTPPATPTPFLHVLTNDDTLLGLAFRYGVSLEQLLAANPGINPQFLSVGKTIIIPLKTGEPTALPAPTMLPLQVSEPICYPAGDGGTWCSLILHNETGQPVENISVWVGLYSAQGKNTASQVVVTPLNVIEDGQAQPLVAYFSTPFDPNSTARAQLLTAIPARTLAKRYLRASILVKDVQISTTGKEAEVRGSVELTGTQRASALWVVAVAYDQMGNVAGMRKWEAEAAPECLPALPSSTATPKGGTFPTATPAGKRLLPAICQAFDLNVFSLGPVIQKVEVLAEARP